MIVSNNQKKILNILADEQFHSGTELAEKLGVSRSAVFKQLKSLTELGLEFFAIRGKGYRIQSPMQLLSETTIKNNLSATASELIEEFEIHDCLDSTNNYLLKKSQHNGHAGSVCFAEYQTAGKGRRGREWISPFGTNIYLSIAWQYQNGPATINGLSLAIGVAVIRALKECGIDEVGLKWPNDIVWRGKKLAGILIEVSGEAGGPCDAVIGLGLNVYLAEEKAKVITQEWVDLNHIVSGHVVSLRNKLASVLLNYLMPTIANFEEDTLGSYLSEWREYDCMLGREANIYMGKQIFSGIVKGIDDNGLLLLKHEQGETKAFASGEVSFRQS